MAASSIEKHRGIVLDRREVAERICRGDALFVYRRELINASSWLPYHPGGALAILHFVGRDPTNEIEAYHPEEVLERIRRYSIGRVEVSEEEGWRPLTPPIALGLVQHHDGVKGHWRREGKVRLAQEAALGVSDQEVESQVATLAPADLEPSSSDLDRRKEHARSAAYQDLRKKLEQAGLLKPPGPLAGYGSDLIRYGVLGGLAALFYFRTTGWAGQMASALSLGLFWHQMTFFAHDLGHTGVTGIWWKDRVIGTLIANFIGGLSIGWWCDNHNIHHLVPNHPEHDPDIQHIPFFAISEHFFGNLWSTYYKRVMAFDGFSKAMISLQHKIYYLVLSLARFNLYANSYIYLLGPKPRRNQLWRLEVIGVAFYWLYFGMILRSQATWGMRLAYLLISHVAASPVHIQIVLSHFACSTEDLGPEESFPSRQLRTTMDVVCSPDVEFIHGGLHLQVTHHLFPRMPRHNLRQASLLVKQYCKEQDLTYREHGWLDGNRKVLTVLADVAKQIELLKQVADAEIEEKMQ